MNGAESSSMSSSHVLIQWLNCQGTWYITILLVHVVGSWARIITQPNSIVLYCQRSFFRNLSQNQYLIQPNKKKNEESLYLIDGDDFTTGLFDFTSLLQKVPETRLCDLRVWSKDSHSIEFRDRVILGGKLASNNLILVKARHVCRWNILRGTGQS